MRGLLAFLLRSLQLHAAALQSARNEHRPLHERVGMQPRLGGGQLVEQPRERGGPCVGVIHDRRV